MLTGRVEEEDVCCDGVSDTVVVMCGELELVLVPAELDDIGEDVAMEEPVPDVGVAGTSPADVRTRLSLLEEVTKEVETVHVLDAGAFADVVAGRFDRDAELAGRVTNASSPASPMIETSVGAC